MGDLKHHVEKLFAISEIEKAGSISKAAIRLKISQPALSQSLQTLEEVMGVKLFTRGPKGSCLTEEGKRIVAYCNKLELELDSLEASLLNPNKVEKKQLLLGMTSQIAAHVWPKILKQKRLVALETGSDSEDSTVFDSSVSILTRDSEALLESLLNNEIHGFMGPEPRHRPGVQVIVIQDIVPYRFYGNASFTAKYGKELSPEQFASCPVASYLNDEICRGSILLSELYKTGFETFPYDLESYDSALAIALHETCLAIVPDYVKAPPGLSPIQIKGKRLPAKNLCLVLSEGYPFTGFQQNSLKMISQIVQKNNLFPIFDLRAREALPQAAFT